LDLIGRDFASQLIEELPDLLLHPIKAALKERDIMRELKQIEQNVSPPQNHFTILKQIYGPTGNENLERLMHHSLHP
jgi:hypothetical protein